MEIFAADIWTIISYSSLSENAVYLVVTRLEHLRTQWRSVSQHATCNRNDAMVEIFFSNGRFLRFT